MYDTIVDYFEDVKPGTPEEKHTKELLGWWTKYVVSSLLLFILTFSCRHLFPQQQSAAASAKSVIEFKSTLQAQRAAKAAAEAAAAVGN